jgi:hypothetical protein
MVLIMTNCPLLRAECHKIIGLVEKSSFVLQIGNIDFVV